MSSSTSNIDLISSSQAAKEVTANDALNAASPAMLFARRGTTSSALTWGYYGGVISVDGVLTTIANGTLTLTASTTCYVEVDRTGVVQFNIVGYTAGNYPLYTVITGAATVTSYTDNRLRKRKATARLALSVAGGVNVTLTAAQASNDILEFSGALTANINVIVPLAVEQWTVFNNTNGAFTLTMIGATGTGTAIGQGKRALIYADGVNVVRATADV